LEVRTYVSAVGTTSLTLSFDIFAQDGAARAKGYLVVVAVDVSTLEKRPLPPEIIERLAPYTIRRADLAAAP
jgi:acyl-CoA thioesterase FadM